MKDNLFETLLNYYVDHEIPAKLWKLFVERRLPEATRWNKDTYNYFNDKYCKNWGSNEKAIQRLLWGIVLDFRHPLTGQKFSLSEWMSFPLHHWKTASGHENKYECFWAALIPIIESGTYGHRWVSNRVDAGKGLTMENWFRDIIDSVLNGKVPQRWRDFESFSEIDLEDFNDYLDSIEDLRKLISIFLVEDL